MSSQSNLKNIKMNGDMRVLQACQSPCRQLDNSEGVISLLLGRPCSLEVQ